MPGLPLTLRTYVHWGKPLHNHMFLSFHLWCLADFTSRPNTISLTLFLSLILLPFTCEVSVVGALMLQPWDTMSLLKADLGSVRGRARSSGSTQPPQQSHPLSPLHEPLQWRAKRDPKAKMLSLQSFLRNGVSLGYGGRNYNLKDLKDPLYFSVEFVE